jgi:hypothetical protein
VFSPTVEGRAPIRGPVRAFLDNFVTRVEQGLLRGAAPHRNRYIVTQMGADRLSFRATTRLSAFNVGLNRVDLDVSSGSEVRYRIEYWQWAMYAVAGSAAIGFFLMAFFLVFDLRGYIASHPGPQYLGLSVEQSVLLAWGMALFWGFVWPWILIELHKRPLRWLMTQLIAEVDSAHTQRT